MSDLESLERRMDEYERKLDDALMKRVVREAGGEEGPARRAGKDTVRIMFGVLILLLGIIWLGKSFGWEWLQQVEIWPLAVIAVGLFIIFGERGR